MPLSTIESTGIHKKHRLKEGILNLRNCNFFQKSGIKHLLNHFNIKLIEEKIDDVVVDYMIMPWDYVQFLVIFS